MIYKISKLLPFLQLAIAISMSFAVGNFVTLRLFLFLFCISFPWNGSQIEKSSKFSPNSNSCADIRCLRIFEYYKKQYSNAVRQKGKGIRIIRIFVPGLIFNVYTTIFFAIFFCIFIRTNNSIANLTLYAWKWMAQRL